jgi:hypothetical protein
VHLKAFAARGVPTGEDHLQHAQHPLREVTSR